MNTPDCGDFRELIPDVAAERRSLDAELTAHLATCGECRAELEIARALFAGRVSAPPGLSDTVIAAVHRDRRATLRVNNRSWWGLSAAAVAALAIGIGIGSERGVQVVDVPDYATELEEGDVWLSDDGLLAGAPALDDLSGEALEALLEELAMGGPGGSV